MTNNGERRYRECRRPSRCCVCGQPIVVGSDIYFTPGEPSRDRHAACIPVAKPSGPQLTDEQEQFIDAALTGRSLLVQAGAGTGKTFTCDLAIRAIFERFRQRSITYTVYNTALKNEAKDKLPKRCRVVTNHGLAYMPMKEQMGQKWMDRLPQPVGLGRRQHGREVAGILNLQDFGVTVRDPATGKDRIRILKAPYLAGYVRKALYNFCCSEESEPSERHVPPIKGLDPDALAKVATFLQPYVRKAWADVTSQEGRLTTTHDVYLKLWAEGGPDGKTPPYIRSEVIFVDEAQDLTGVMFKILAQQRHAQFVLVGDSAQELYGYRGAVNALDRFERERADVVTLYLSTSFRFGPKIAETANVVLAALGTPLRLTGAGFQEGCLQMVANPDAILCRSNAGVMRAAMDMLLSRVEADEAGMDLKDYNEPYLLGGADEIVAFCQAALDLKEGRRTDHPELGCFSDWAEVETYVAEDPSADDLALFVKLVNDYGAQELLDAAMQMPTKPGPGITTLATIHRTKGLEWEGVRLGDDFREYEKAREIPKDELRVIYVGLTRAKRYLEPYGCQPLMLLLEAGPAALWDEDDEEDDLEDLFEMRGERL